MIWTIIVSAGAVPFTVGTCVLGDHLRTRKQKQLRYKPNLELEEVQEDENIKALEQMYIDGKIETIEELEHRVELVMSPEARAIEQAKLDYQSDWVMAIHHNNMLDQIAEQRRLDEEYFFEHGKPRPKPIIVQPQRQLSASAYAVVTVAHGYGSAASFGIPPTQYVDLTNQPAVLDKPKWAKQAEAARHAHANRFEFAEMGQKVYAQQKQIAKQTWSATLSG